MKEKINYKEYQIVSSIFNRLEEIIKEKFDTDIHWNGSIFDATIYIKDNNQDIENYIKNFILKYLNLNIKIKKYEENSIN